MKSFGKIVFGALVVILLVAGYFFVRQSRTSSRSVQVMQWIRNPEAHSEWAVSAGQRCGNAPFLLPTAGFIGFLWDDSFRPGHRHQGIDVFGGQDVGITPIYSAYDGYLTRLADWKSTVIIRIPSDPLNPGRQIWTYYTHMADAQGQSFVSEAFPPGTHEVFVPAGTLLGYQGNYSGTPGNPTGVHLHFSIVLDNGDGQFLNELDIANTLDPSPYLGLNLSARSNSGEIPLCPPATGEE